MSETGELLPCPFCGSKIRHVESWAKSFRPPRLYHEWQHIDANPNCWIAGFRTIVGAANDKPEDQEAAKRRWNTRTQLQADGEAVKSALIRAKCTSPDGTYVHASMEDVLRALASGEKSEK